jgi:hypothetical protein
VLASQRHLGRKIPNGSRYGSDGHVGQEPNRSFPGDDDDRSAPAR